jgi:hypothetical protein
VSVIEAIHHATTILPEEPALDGEQGPRWQAINRMTLAGEQIMRFIYCVCLFMLIGCSQQKETSLTSSASFDANPPNWGGAKANDHLKATISPDGPHDKLIVIEGTATSPFLVVAGVSQQRGDASGSVAADILFQVNDGKLSPLGDGTMSGGGERPAFRRESDRALVVYYPLELEGERSWARFKIMMEK